MKNNAVTVLGMLSGGAVDVTLKKKGKGLKTVISVKPRARSNGAEGFSLLQE